MLRDALRPPPHMTALEVTRLRTGQGWTKTEMARRLDVSRRTVWNWERQSWRVPRVVLLAIKRAIEEVQHESGHH